MARLHCTPLHGAEHAQHGAAHPEDVAVPIGFYGPGIAAQRLARRVRTMDIGPTLAACIGVAPTEAVDGRVLEEVVGY